MMKELLSYWW